MNKETLQASVERPGWTQKNLHAYRDRITKINGRTVIIKDYYVKSKGLK